MAKSISLSFDMQDLYLVDNSNKTKKFSLSGNGVDLKLNASGDLMATPGSSNMGPTGIIRAINNNKWTFAYDEPSNELFCIGILDIVAGRTPEVNGFDLGKAPVNVRIIGASIFVTLRVS